jgi:hypothetical protein
VQGGASTTKSTSSTTSFLQAHQSFIAQGQPSRNCIMARIRHPVSLLTWTCRPNPSKRICAVETQHLRPCVAPFHSSPNMHTDGVFRALTESRVKTPWIEAFRKQQHENGARTNVSSQSTSSANRKLEPKRMSDSFHSVVSKLKLEFTALR